MALFWTQTLSPDGAGAGAGAGAGSGTGVGSGLGPQYADDVPYQPHSEQHNEVSAQTPLPTLPAPQL